MLGNRHFCGTERMPNRNVVTRLWIYYRGGRQKCTGREGAQSGALGSGEPSLPLGICNSTKKHGTQYTSSLMEKIILG